MHQQTVKNQFKTSYSQSSRKQSDHHVIKIKGVRALDELTGSNKGKKTDYSQERMRKNTTKESAMDQDTEQKELSSYMK
jgi:hypothetical protein